MKRILTAITAVALLTACGDGEPFFGPDTDGNVNEIDNLGPGTKNPTPNGAIQRFEPRTGDGGGLVRGDVRYNARRDTFTVDNIAFDGENVYQRHDGLETLGGYKVFAGDEVTDDFLTGEAIDQIVPYRAIYGVSRRRVGDSPRTQFAIVRTGGYFDFGFGGYVYERAGGVVLPDSGQARFTGKYGGMQIQSGGGGLAFVRGDMRLDIDFNDFNRNDGIKGRIFNRRLLTDDGDPITQLSDVFWVIEEGTKTLTRNGEIKTEVFTLRRGSDGALERDFEGTFSGIVAGDTTAGSGGEVVGVIKMEREDQNVEGVVVQETGGAILYRR